jgi:hypothetical protein
MADARDLVGRWRLVSWIAVHDDGRVEHPVGDRPQGVAVLGADGWMAVQVAATARPTMSSPDPFSATESEQAQAFATYLAYVARYEVHGDELQLSLEMSLYPQWAGTTQWRGYRFDGDELVLRPPPVDLGGRRVVSEIRWQRDAIT